jgi:hypothetical protein
MSIETFFENLGFNFNTDLKLKSLVFEKNESLTQKIQNSFYFYDNKNSKINFYLIATELEKDELKEIRKYVWNKNDADLILHYHKDKTDVLYAKTAPDTEELTYKIKTFEGKDIEKVQEIQKWQFDSGAFWLNYQDFLDKVKKDLTKKYQTINKVLVATLNKLKSNLYEEISRIEKQEDKRQEVVQALIDRTLYIKFLEDKQIINSYFHEKYFNDEKADFKFLLENNKTQEINQLFDLVHKIFNNQLFETTEINTTYLTNSVCQLIAESFNKDARGQLRLFDFQFDVMPVELISYIYETFLTKEQIGNGIYYTPRKLAQLIVDDVIREDRIGSILDPSCGSGMFLIVGFQRLLEIAQKQNLEPKNIKDKINFRANLLSENIFGIEKQKIAQRFTLFSLSLQIFEDIEAQEIKLIIESELKEKGEVQLFDNSNFYNNIICQNALSIDKPAFKDRVFDYIVGNPPFVTGKNKSEDAVTFKNDYKSNEFNAQKTIAGYQISQCFFLKIKDWSNENTRFGFVSNSSNFYDSEQFQDFFFQNYGVEIIYELSRVKKMLFESAKESVVSIIFNNKKQFETINYYPVDIGLFSEKPFELLIVQEESVIKIKQEDLISKTVRLRDFLVGNEFDRVLVDKLLNYDILEKYLLKSKYYSSFRGLTRISNKELLLKYNMNDATKTHISILHKKLENEYLTKEKSINNDTPFLYTPDDKIFPFKIIKFDGYINKYSLKSEYFQRIRNYFIYEEKKIIFNKFGKNLNAVYCNYDLVFSNLVYSIKLNNEDYYYLFSAILNSRIISFFYLFKNKSRVDDNFPNLNTKAIKNTPIPKNLDNYLVEKISQISKDLTDGKFEFAEKEEELNELIYDLYDLSYNERQRIKDFFVEEPNKQITNTQIVNYKEAIIDCMELYFSNEIFIEDADLGELRIIKLSFGKINQPLVKKTGYYFLNEMFQQNSNNNILFGQEIMIGKNEIYIFKKNSLKNWTETKAFEDSRYILNNVIYEQ